MGLIMERSLFQPSDDPGNADKVCDMAERQDIVITRMKDRFIACPSAGRWRYCSKFDASHARGKLRGAHGLSDIALCW